MDMVRDESKDEEEKRELESVGSLEGALLAGMSSANQGKTAGTKQTWVCVI